MTHHPHVHMIVPGGGISLDGDALGRLPSKLLLPVKVLSRLFRRLMLEMLLAAHEAGRLQFFGDHAHLAGKAAFKAYLAPLHRTKWFVYSQAAIRRAASRCWPICPATPTASRSPIAASLPPTHRRDVQIEGLSDRGPGRYKTMTLIAAEFIRRFLIHVLPSASTASALRTARQWHQDREHRASAC